MVGVTAKRAMREYMGVAETKSDLCGKPSRVDSESARVASGTRRMNPCWWARLYSCTQFRGGQLARARRVTLFGTLATLRRRVASRVTAGLHEGSDAFLSHSCLLAPHSAARAYGRGLEGDFRA